METIRNSLRRAAPMLAALVAAPVVSRILLVSDTGSAWALQDLRGFLSDLGVVLLALPLAMLARRISRWIGVLFIQIWTLLHWLNFEAVAELDSLGSVHDLAFLTDEEFLIGSATAISRPIVLLFLCIVTGFLVWRSWGGWSIRIAGASLTAAGVMFLGQGLWPTSQDVADWRQSDFIQANAVYLMRGETRQSSRSNDPRVAMLELVPEMAANLDGEPILPLPGAATNILLVMVEGVSGAFVPSLAADHNFSGLFEMRNLDQIATSALSYSTFVTQNRKTNRGVFALLCGEPPNLVPGSPKMTQVAMMGGRLCLPQVLKDAGFETAFLQAAPLAFMVKDQFAAQTGFNRIYGREHFDAGRAAAQNKWGIDDLSLFEQSLEVIGEIDAGSRPWFVSLLTVGTHHPYVFPENFTASQGDAYGRRRNAFEYADRAVGWLVEELEDLGILDDTVVLITSDESRGALARDQNGELPMDAVARRLTQNWGFLAILQPEKMIHREREPVAQMDVAISVLDYLGLSDRPASFFGRSVFRKYQESRFVPFANTNLLRAGAIESGGTFFDCRIDTSECRKWSIQDRSFFGVDRVQLEWDEPADAWVLALARRSQAEALATGAEYEIELLANPRQHVGEIRLLHGGPYITLIPGQWLEVDIEVEARGPDGTVSFKHLVAREGHWGVARPADEEKAMFNKKYDLKDRDRLTLNYTLVPAGGGRMDGVKVESHAVVVDGAPFELVFHRAIMRVHVGEGRPEPGFRLHQQELTRPSNP